jgi:hypothetical protein
VVGGVTSPVVQASVVDAEVVPDFVDNGPADLVGDFLTGIMTSRRERPGLVTVGGRAGLLRSCHCVIPLTARQASKWGRQVEQMHELVPAWTGNPLQVVEMSTFEWADHRRRRTALFTEIDRDAIQVAGETSLISTRAGHL